MIVKKNCFLVEVADRYEFPLGLKVQCHWATEQHNFKNHTGIIIGTPIRIDNQYFKDYPLVIGDRVMISHAVTEKRYEVGHNKYMAEYFDLFAKFTDNGIVPLDEFLIIEREMEAANVLLYERAKQSQKFGRLVAASERAKELGVEVGDRIYFTHNANYEYRVDAKLYTRIRIRNIIGVERNGELIALKNRAIVKPFERKSEVNGFVFKEKSIQRDGVAIKSNINGVIDGEIVTYFDDLATKLHFNNIEYSILAQENIKYVWN